MSSLLSSTEINGDPLIPTIFHEPWWLEIATEGRYSVVEVVEQGAVVGRMPYYLKNRLGCFPVVDLPPLTHFLGPAIVDCEGKPHKKFAHRQEITRQLILKLPQTASFYVKCHKDVTDVLAFQGAGFRTSIQFTQELLPQPIDDLWTRMRGKTRQAIRGANARCEVVAGTDPEEFMRFYNASIEKNKGVPSHMETLVHTNLIRACLARGCGKIYEAREANGKLASAVFCAWDNVASYYLMTSRIPQAHYGSTDLLVWNAIRDAVQRNLMFDFDGVVSFGGVRSANNFAATLSPRYIATFETVPVQILRSLKSLIEPKSRFY